MFKSTQKPGTFCPFIKKACIEHDCAMYTHIRGANPNDGGDIDHYGCAFAWMPILAIENSQQQRQTGAAVESLRNRVDEGNKIVAAGIAQRAAENDRLGHVGAPVNLGVSHAIEP